jgi:protein-tyrosine phosphatase
MYEEARIERVIVDQTAKPQQRHLDFDSTKNFRDLGGYRTVDGKTLRWELLYRSGGLHKLTDRDLQHLSALSLNRVIDFRSEYEKGLEPDRLPIEASIQRVEIPILDASTAVVQDSRDEFVRNLRTIDPVKYMLETYVGFVMQFTPAFQQFIRELAFAEGRPVLFHCTAGKDRTGYASAILLRMLGVPHETVTEDYLLSNDHFYAGHKWNLMLARLLKGKRFADSIKGFMIADPRYLSAAFETIDREYGSFENYIRDGLGLSTADVEHFKAIYLE